MLGCGNTLLSVLIFYRYGWSWLGPCARPWGLGETIPAAITPFLTEKEF